MQNTKRVIDYKAKFAPDGTVYSQTITVANDEFNHLMDCLVAERVNTSRPNDYEYNLYLKQRLNISTNIIFLNLTQRDFFNSFLKVKLLDRNTCLKIKN